MFSSAIAACIQVRGDDLSSKQVFVLLQNGNVLKGQISKQADRIAIMIDGNSTLLLDPKQIEHVGPTLESLYLHQRAGVRTWGTGEHWHLAHWCIQQNLVDHAIEHFQALEKTASGSPRFKQLEHLLREALLKNKNENQSVETNSSEVVQASAEMPKQSPPLLERNRPEEWTNREIPGYIRKTFQTSVLPILVTRCGQSGCHGLLGKSDFHVYQPVGDQALTVLTNDLHEVLRYIDSERVQDSALLAYATKAHGILRNPSLNPAKESDRGHIDRINQWVKSLALSQRIETTMPAQYPSAAIPAQTANASTVTQAIATVPVAPNTRPSRASLGKSDDSQNRDAKLSKPAKTAAPAVFLSGSEIADLESTIEKLEQKFNGTDASKSSANKDPFDVDSFNRKFR
ncbi:MAG: hypothetical protein K9M08_10800 [Pirellula sp.]|nr:hypothetical protein [Pirellula sp.]